MASPHFAAMTTAKFSFQWIYFHNDKALPPPQKKKKKNSWCNPTDLNFVPTLDFKKIIKHAQN